MNSPERIFVIGDIHGCLDKLEQLWERIDPHPDKDQLVFLGDYIDRGEDSSGVLEYLLQLQQAYAETIFLMGNHEKMFIDFLEIKGKPKLHEFFHNKISKLACRTAIKAGDEISLPQIKQYIVELVDKDIPYTCPHGRPIMIKFSMYEIEKMFKRVV